jgi:hypothetical protein
MKEQLITSETAKLASEKGYSPILLGDNFKNDLPTQSLLQRWLREVHNIDINMAKDSLDIYHCSVYNNLTVCNPLFSRQYEEALEKGLQEALKLI